MSNRVNELLELYDYNAWATRRMFEATGVLSDEELTRDMKSSFPSVRDTLVHMVGAEWVWLTRWLGTSPTSFPDADSLKTNADLVQRWSEIDAQRRDFMRSLTDESLDGIVAYTSFAGVSFAFPLGSMLRHVVNHSSYHRGQIMTLLRQLGHKAIQTDMILMLQQVQQATAPATNS